MCGSNRLVSVQEIKESERKLKINSLLRLHSPSFTISVKKYLLEFSDSVESITPSKGDQNFIEEFPYDQLHLMKLNYQFCSMTQGMLPKSHFKTVLWWLQTTACC